MMPSHKICTDRVSRTAPHLALALLSLAAAAQLSAASAPLPEVSFPGRPVWRWQRPQPVPEGIRPLDVETNQLIRANEARSTYHLSGAGLTAAILDTGINRTHKDFTGKIVAQHNYTRDNGGNANNAEDGDGHGSNVAGILLADGSPHTGVAPKANVIPLKILDNEGNGNSGTVATALQWVIDNRVKYHISVVNLSLGDGSNLQDESSRNGDPVQGKIRTLRSLGVAVCCAAGNDYHTFGSQGMGSPAIFRECVSVGAVYDANIGSVSYLDGGEAFSTGPDRICPFSQRLHDTVNADCRTDIFAPGAALTSAGIRSATSSTIMHGTSQATPVVAGAILLLQEYYSRLNGGALPSVAKLEKWLRAGAASINDGDNEDDNVPNTGLNFPRLDVVGAIQQLIADQNSVSYSVNGRVTLDGTGLGGVTIASGEQTVQTRPDGTYTVPGLAAGEYTITASRPTYSFAPDSLPVTLTTANATGVNFQAVSLGPPPSVPNPLRASQVTKTTCVLRWTDRSVNETGFTLEGRASNTTFITLGTLAPNAAGVTITGLSPHTTYIFRVNAFNVSGPSKYTNTVKITTKRGSAGSATSSAVAPSNE